MSKIIHLLNKTLALHQPEGGFQTSIDAVLLAAACPVRSGESLIDLGCGGGAAGLCVLKRVEGVHLTGVELLAHEAELAEKNAVMNDLSSVVVNSDIRNYKGERADHVICNPPYLTAGAHIKSPSAAKASAMGHDETNLDDWIKAAHRVLKSKGSFTMIHRADMLDEIIVSLGKKFGATEIIPLWPKDGREAKRIIVRTRKDRYSPMRLHAGIVLHKENGDYTVAAEDILRGGKSLCVGD